MYKLITTLIISAIFYSHNLYAQNKNTNNFVKIFSSESFGQTEVATTNKKLEIIKDSTENIDDFFKAAAVVRFKASEVQVVDKRLDFKIDAGIQSSNNVEWKIIRNTFMKSPSQSSGNQGLELNLTPVEGQLPLKIMGFQSFFIDYKLGNSSSQCDLGLEVSGSFKKNGAKGDVVPWVGRVGKRFNAMHLSYEEIALSQGLKRMRVNIDDGFFGQDIYLDRIKLFLNSGSSANPCLINFQKISLVNTHLKKIPSYVKELYDFEARLGGPYLNPLIGVNNQMEYADVLGYISPRGAAGDIVQEQGFSKHTKNNFYWPIKATLSPETRLFLGELENTRQLGFYRVLLKSRGKILKVLYAAPNTSVRLVDRPTDIDGLEFYLISEVFPYKFNVSEIALFNPKISTYSNAIDLKIPFSMTYKPEIKLIKGDSVVGSDPGRISGLLNQSGTAMTLDLSNIAAKISGVEIHHNLNLKAFDGGKCPIRLLINFKGYKDENYYCPLLEYDTIRIPFGVLESRGDDREIIGIDLVLNPHSPLTDELESFSLDFKVYGVEYLSMRDRIARSPLVEKGGEKIFSRSSNSMQFIPEGNIFKLQVNLQSDWIKKILNNPNPVTLLKSTNYEVTEFEVFISKEIPQGVLEKLGGIQPPEKHEGTSLKIIYLCLLIALLYLIHKLRIFSYKRFSFSLGFSLLNAINTVLDRISIGKKFLIATLLWISFLTLGIKFYGKYTYENYYVSISTIFLAISVAYLLQFAFNVFQNKCWISRRIKFSYENSCATGVILELLLSELIYVFDGPILLSEYLACTAFFSMSVLALTIFWVRCATKFCKD